MRRKNLRLTASILSVLMVISSFPLPVLAAGGTNIEVGDTFQDNKTFSIERIDGTTITNDNFNSYSFNYLNGTKSVQKTIEQTERVQEKTIAGAPDNLVFLEGKNCTIIDNNEDGNGTANGGSYYAGYTKTTTGSEVTYSLPSTITNAIFYMEDGTMLSPSLFATTSNSGNINSTFSNGSSITQQLTDEGEIGFDYFVSTPTKTELSIVTDTQQFKDYIVTGIEGNIVSVGVEMEESTAIGTMGSITIDSTTANSATITWNDVTNATKYDIYKDSLSESNKVVEDLRDNSYTITGLVANTTYTIYVLPKNETESGTAGSKTVTTSTKKATEIKTSYKGGDVVIGEEFDTSKLSFEVTYDDKTTETKLWNDLTTKPETIIASQGNNTLTAAIGDVETTFDIWGITVTGLTATYTGTSLAIGETVPVASVKVTATYGTNSEGKTGTTGEVSNWTFVGENKITSSEDNSFTIEYAGKNATFNIAGFKEISTLEASYVKESVLVGTDFDTAKVSVKVLYKDGSTRAVAYSELTTVPSSKKVTLVGDNGFTVGYGGKTTTLTVHGYELESLTATYSGPKMILGTEVDKGKISVKAVYTKDINGAAKTANVTDYTVDTLKISATGTNVIVVSYGGKSVDLKITGYEISSLSADYDDESILVGEKFDKDDVTVKVKYTDGSSDKIGFDDLTDTPDSRRVTKAGWNSFKLTYKGFTATLEVHGYKMDKIQVTYSGGNKPVGTTLTASMFSVLAYYTEDWDGNIKTENLSGFTISPTTLTKEGENEITVTVNGLSTKIKVVATKADGTSVDGTAGTNGAAGAAGTTGGSGSAGGSGSGSGSGSGTAGASDIPRTADETNFFILLLMFGVSISGMGISSSQLMKKED